MMISHLSTPNSPADKAYQLPGAFHLKTGFIQKHDHDRDDHGRDDQNLKVNFNIPHLKIAPLNGRNDQPHLTDQWTTPISFTSIFPLFPPGANKTLCWGFITNIPIIALDFLIMLRNRVKKEVFSKPRLLQSWFALIVVQHWNVHLEWLSNEI